MKYNFTIILAFAVLGLSACTSVDNNPEEITEEPVLEESSARDSYEYKSENGDFVYYLNYSAESLTLSEDSYEGASANAPSFDIVGDGHISLATNWIDSPGYDMSNFIRDNYYAAIGGGPSDEPDPSMFGENEVYRFSIPFPGCLIEYGVLKGLDEALSVRMEVCNESQEVLDNGLRVFEELLENISLERVGRGTE